MKASYLVRGTPGHPLHPPLTDVTIGSYALATILGVLGWIGVAEPDLAKGWWLGLIVGLIASAPTALTGFADWVRIPKETPLWRTASLHALSNVVATAFFSIAAVAGHIPFHEARVSGGALLLTVLGFAFLTLGGWLGGAITYVHGMRVLNLADEPTHRAAAPVTEEKEAAERP